MNAVGVSRRRVLGGAAGVLAARGLLTAASPAVLFETSVGDDAGLIALCDRIEQIEDFIRQYHAGGADTVEAEDARNAAMAPLEAEQARLIDEANAVRARTLDGVRARARALVAWQPDFLVKARGLGGAMVTALLCDLVGDGGAQ